MTFIWVSSQPGKVLLTEFRVFFPFASAQIFSNLHVTTLYPAVWRKVIGQKNEASFYFSSMALSQTQKILHYFNALAPLLPAEAIQGEVNCSHWVDTHCQRGKLSAGLCAADVVPGGVSLAGHFSQTLPFPRVNRKGSTTHKKQTTKCDKELAWETEIIWRRIL